MKDEDKGMEIAQFMMNREQARQKLIEENTKAGKWPKFQDKGGKGGKGKGIW